MTKSKPTLKDELIAAIQNEDNRFDMSRFTTNDRRATCKTACCMAGHIEALRPELAKKFLLEHSDLHLQGHSSIDHEGLAAAIWEHEMGEKCRLDFFAYKFKGEAYLEDITRKQAIAHIKGKSRNWPLRTLREVNEDWNDTRIS